MELPFDSFPIADLRENLDPGQNIWDLWWVSPKDSSISLYSYYICEPHTYQCLIMSRQAQWHLGNIGKR